MSIALWGWALSTISSSRNNPTLTPVNFQHLLPSTCNFYCVNANSTARRSKSRSGPTSSRMLIPYSHSPPALPLPEQLKRTLQSLPSLPESFAEARRTDPLTRLEAELNAITPFIQAYREQQSQCLSRLANLTAFVAEVRAMKAVVEKEKYSGMVCHRTDLHEMRDIVLRQLLRLFDATLDYCSEHQAIAAPAQGIGKQTVNALDCSTAPSSILCEVKLPKGKSAGRSFRFLTPLKETQKTNFVAPLVRTPGPSTSVRRLVDLELKGDLSDCGDSAEKDDGPAIVIRL